MALPITSDQRKGIGELMQRWKTINTVTTLLFIENDLVMQSTYMGDFNTRRFSHYIGMIQRDAKTLLNSGAVCSNAGDRRFQAGGKHSPDASPIL